MPIRSFAETVGEPKRANEKGNLEVALQKSKEDSRMAGRDAGRSNGIYMVAKRAVAA